MNKLKYTLLITLIVFFSAVFILAGCEENSSEPESNGSLTINGLSGGSGGYAVFVFNAGTDISSFQAINEAIYEIRNFQAQSVRRDGNMFTLYSWDGTNVKLGWKGSGSLPVVLLNNSGSYSDADNPTFRYGTVNFNEGHGTVEFSVFSPIVRVSGLAITGLPSGRNFAVYVFESGTYIYKYNNIVNAFESGSYQAVGAVITAGNTFALTGWDGLSETGAAWNGSGMFPVLLYDIDGSTTDKTNSMYSFSSIYFGQGYGVAKFSDFMAVVDIPLEISGQLAEIIEWLEEQPLNTVNTPYDIILTELNLETDLSDGYDPLGLLYHYLAVRFITIDLTGCYGTWIGGGDRIYIDARPNADKIVGIHLPDTVEDIRDYAFYPPSWNMRERTLPAGLKRIGRTAIGYQSLITGELFLPDTLEYIGEGAFFMNYGITSVSLPANIEIDSNPFRACSSLSTFTVRGIGNLSTLDNGRILMDGNTLISCPTGNEYEVINDPKITAIGTLAFAHRMNTMTNIEIWSPVTIIQMGAFQSCNLVKAVFPAQLTQLGNYIFYQVPSVIVFNGTTPPQIFANSIASGSVPENLTIYVPDASVQAYKTAANWTAYASYIRPMSEQ
ncbi:MAG: leucine-rich repeat domain-containing protein [Treponema sp.]|nr:leucine-rich repeat domain-containing protein [Treponema sp.]